MAFLIVVLISMLLGFLLSRLPLKVGIPSAIFIPFLVVYTLNSLYEWFVPITGDGGVTFQVVAYFTVSIPGAVIALLSIWISRKFIKPSK